MINEMMDRPVVLPNLVDYLRKSQRKFDGYLGELEKWCNENRVPIIPHETAVFLDFQLGLIKPNNILEIGTAVGFSGSLMAKNLPENGTLTTIDRNPVMYERAKENFVKTGVADKVEILEGDAAEILPKLDKKFDFIFMDSAKAKYIEFFPYCMKVLEDGGILMVDDIFQGGTILDEIETIPRRVRKIHKRLNQFLDFIQNDDSIKTTLLPLGDGIVLIQKLKEKDYMYILDNLD